MPSRIKIILKSVYVKKDGRFWGKAKWKLNADAGGAQIGKPDEIFVVTNGTTITPTNWHTVCEVTRTSSIPVKLHAKEQARFFADDFGSMTHTLKWPFAQGTFALENQNYKATFEVLNEARGTFKRHDPREVFACRQTAGSPECTTVSGATQKARFEVCEVRPTPPVAYLPTRLAGVTGKVCFSSSTGITIAAADPINVLPNPPVIPIMAKKDATDKTCARIELGFYQPDELKLDLADTRLEWSITTGADKAKIHGSACGMKVLLYGVAEGDVLLELKFLGATVATYRAIVRNIRKVKCRVNLLDGGAGFKANSSAADVVNHLAVANRILRQAGVELDLDTSATVSNGAVKLQDGIFRVPLSAAKKGLAKNLPGDAPPATRLNRKSEVLNLCYCVSMASATTLGQAVVRPLNKSAVPVGGSFPQLTDSGTPSSSWIKPSGVYPHAAATAQTIEMMNEKLDPNIPAADRKKHWAVTVCNGNAGDMQFGNTMAHEICHALGLAHRELTQDLLPELNENLMHATEGPLTAQDLDILQAKAIHNSPMVT